MAIIKYVYIVHLPIPPSILPSLPLYNPHYLMLLFGTELTLTHLPLVPHIRINELGQH